MAMTRGSLRRTLFLLKAYVAVTALSLMFLGASAFRAAKPSNLGEVTVERINVVDANGTRRMVITNKDRMPNEFVTRSGKTGHRSGEPSAGILFYNDEGHENGGLIWAG